MIRIAPDVKGKIVLAFFTINDTQCQAKNEPLWESLTELAENYRRRFGSPAEANPFLQPARRLYRSIGLEPTKYRPSSEALLRRALQGKPFYQINSIVDCGNYCSLSYLLPIGLYDWDKIQGTIDARMGKPEETYEGIGKGVKHAEGKLVLADELGPFGNPSADSQRTMVTLETTNILWVIFAPANYPRHELEEHLEFSVTTFLQFHPGTVGDRGIIE